jgi:hypothetical protein
MGIKGLFQFLSKCEQRVFVTDAVHGKSVGIDMFWFLHQSKGDSTVIHNYLTPMIQHAKEVHCVWDGTPTSDTAAIRKEREGKRQQLMDTIIQLDNALTYQMEQLSEENEYVIHAYMDQLRKRAWKPTPDYIHTVKKWLKEQGCYQYQERGQADELLRELEMEKKIELVITNDSDLLTLGCACVLRIYNSVEGGLYDAKYIYSRFHWTKQQWKNFMKLCRDMKHPDILMAYSWISVYRDMDIISQKQMEWKNDIPAIIKTE